VEEKSLLASKDEVLSRAEMNAKLGDQIAAQERLNRLQDTSQKYVTQMGEKTRALVAAAVWEVGQRNVRMKRLSSGRAG
jgi:hypothetical protein